MADLSMDDEMEAEPSVGEAQRGRLHSWARPHLMRQSAAHISGDSDTPVAVPLRADAWGVWLQPCQGHSLCVDGVCRYTQCVAGRAALSIISIHAAGRYGQQLRTLTAQTVAQASLLLKKSSKRGARTRRQLDQMSEGPQQTASTVHAAKASEEAEQAIQEMMQAAGGALLLKLHAVGGDSHTTPKHWCRLHISCLCCCCCVKPTVNTRTSLLRQLPALTHCTQASCTLGLGAADPAADQCTPHLFAGALERLVGRAVSATHAAAQARAEMHAAAVTRQPTGALQASSPPKRQSIIPVRHRKAVTWADVESSGLTEHVLFYSEEPTCNVADSVRHVSPPCMSAIATQLFLE